jgi:hypothetical protein
VGEIRYARLQELNRCHSPPTGCRECPEFRAVPARSGTAIGTRCSIQVDVAAVRRARDGGAESSHELLFSPMYISEEAEHDRDYVGEQSRGEHGGDDLGAVTAGGRETGDPARFDDA